MPLKGIKKENNGRSRRPVCSLNRKHKTTGEKKKMTTGPTTRSHLGGGAVEDNGRNRAGALKSALCKSQGVLDVPGELKDRDRLKGAKKLNKKKTKHPKPARRAAVP